tara:strand:+ start:1786 stop:2499 length:714 start_codon:yes stop_codon:yes gene_type:complete
MPNLVGKSNFNLIRNKASQLVGMNPAITDRELCEQLNITPNALKRIKQDKLFYEKAEDIFAKNITRDLLLVDVAMIREAQAGNVQAARYLAERHGKFTKKFQIEVKSPYELFAKEMEADDAEYEEMNGETEPMTLSQTELPPRDERNNKPIVRARTEKKKLHKTLTRMKRERSPQYKADKNDRYSLRKRAEAVGLERLPAGRPKDHVKRAWLEKLYKLEAEKREEKTNQVFQEAEPS